MRIGVIGLGIMGRPWRGIFRAGHESRSTAVPGAGRRAGRRGCRGDGFPAAVAAAVEALITMRRRPTWRRWSPVPGACSRRATGLLHRHEHPSTGRRACGRRAPGQASRFSTPVSGVTGAIAVRSRWWAASPLVRSAPRRSRGAQARRPTWAARAGADDEAGEPDGGCVHARGGRGGRRPGRGRQTRAGGDDPRALRWRRGLVDAGGAGAAHAARRLHAGLHGAAAAEGPPPGPRRRRGAGVALPTTTVAHELLAAVEAGGVGALGTQAIVTALERRARRRS